MSEWTKTPPTESGCYWWRENSKDDWQMFSVFVGTHSSCVWVSKNTSVGLDDLGGEWYPEPIQEPPQ